MKRAAIFMFVVWVIALSGCNTMKGFGKDMEKAGESIQKKADK